ncbi:MAG: hypothetical protein KDD51_13480 [Bdellovibrionales bacterium]|nr:hypothetical protein [Bdellovibrionales bacterium]
MQSAQLKTHREPPPPSETKAHVWVLYLGAGIAAFTAIAYELLLASYATFLLGASIFQYSFVLSLMMASMGMGALATRRKRFSSLEQFLGVEVLLSWLAAAAIPTLYAAFASTVPPHLVLLFFVVGIGVGIGMEIPLLNDMHLSGQGLSKILFYDYFGGFVGGLFFPVLLLPELGFFRLGAVLAVVNAALGLVVTVVYRKELRNRFKFWLGLTLITIALAASGLYFAEALRRYMEWEFFKIYKVL